MLVCPSDERTAATNFNMLPGNSAAGAYLANANVSFFVGKDAQDGDPQMLLVGDRHIVGQAPGGNLPNPIPGGGYGNVGAVALGTNFVAGTQTPAWTEKVHRGKGNVLLSDGSAPQVYTAEFGAVPVGKRLFVWASTMVDGFESLPRQFQARVPAA